MLTIFDSSCRGLSTFRICLERAAWSTDLHVGSDLRMASSAASPFFICGEGRAAFPLPAAHAVCRDVRMRGPRLLGSREPEPCKIPVHACFAIYRPHWRIFNQVADYGGAYPAPPAILNDRCASCASIVHVFQDGEADDAVIFGGYHDVGLRKIALPHLTPFQIGLYIDPVRLRGMPDVNGPSCDARNSCNAGIRHTRPPLPSSGPLWNMITDSGQGFENDAKSNDTKSSFPLCPLSFTGCDEDEKSRTALL